MSNEKHKYKIGDFVQFETPYGIATARVKAVQYNLDRVTITKCSQPYFNDCVVRLEDIIISNR